MNDDKEIAQHDVNGVQLEIGQTVCFHSGNQPLAIGIIEKIKPVKYQGYINVFIRPWQATSKRLRNCQIRSNILVLDQLLSTYL